MTGCQADRGTEAPLNRRVPATVWNFPADYDLEVYTVNKSEVCGEIISRISPNKAQTQKKINEAA